MTIQLSGSNGVTFPSTTVQGDAGIGYGQTWQSFTVGTQRILGTTYTNSTGKPIMVSTGNVGTGATNTLVIGGVTVGQVGTSGGTRAQLAGIVPNNTTYAVTGAGTIEYWAELR